jgi:hypothetical protein
MPCIFGASPGERERFRSLEAHFRSVFGDLEVASCGDVSLGAQAHRPHQAVRRTDDALIAVMGERGLYRALLDPDPVAQLTSNGSLSAAVRGNLAMASRGGGLSVGCDWLSSFPFYYAATSAGVIFSSHLAPLARVLGADIDPAGAVQYLTVGYCLNGRTPLAGIRRLLPGQQLSWDPTAPAGVRVVEHSRLWEGEPDREVDVARVWELLCNAVPADDGMPAGVMLSAGWDSRVLLAAVGARATSRRIQTASHGQPDQFELRMARRLALRAGADHHEVALGRDALGSVADQDDLFNRAEALMFPYWRLSADALVSSGASYAAAGVLGEVLGGHYVPPGSRSKRLRHFINVRRGKAQTPAETQNDLEVVMPKVPRNGLWYVHREYFEDHRQVLEEAYAQDAADTVARYRARGVPAGDRAVEAFITEHRAIQIIAHQPLVSFSRLDVVLPFGDRLLAQEVTRLPLRDRIQNALSRQLLARYAPALLKVPHAATGVPASVPIPVQVVGRASRYALEALSSAALFASRGRVGRRRPFGWMNFEQVLRPTDPLRAIVRDVRAPFIDKAAVESHLDDVEAYRQPIKLAHIYLKFAQLDRVLGKRSFL